MKSFLIRLLGLQQPAPPVPTPECYYCGERLFTQQDKDRKCCDLCDLGNAGAYYPVKLDY